MDIPWSGSHRGGLLRSADRLPLVNEGDWRTPFYQRMRVLERARALEMDPDDYERSLRAWDVCRFMPEYVPQVWDERND